MNKIMNIPEGLVHEIPDLDNELLIGNVVISLVKGNERVFGNVLLPVMVMREAIAQVMLLVLIHNNRESFTVEDMSELLPKINFRYTKETDYLKQYHIGIILGDEDEPFIQFANELLVNILEAYLRIPSSEIDDARTLYSQNADDLKFKDGISIVHSVLMRVIVSIIFDSSRMNDYREYERKLLPMTKYHLLHKEEDVVNRTKALLKKDDALTDDETCLFNEITVQHSFFNLVFVLDGIIKEIFLEGEFDDEGLKPIPNLQNFFKDYPIDEPAMERIQYILNKLLRIDAGVEKCAYVLNGEVVDYMKRLFKQPYGT